MSTPLVSVVLPTNGCPWLGEAVSSVLGQTMEDLELVVVPFFLSDGLHVAEDIPVMLGEPERVVRQRLARGLPTWRNPTERGGKLVWYTASVGTAPVLAEVILERVAEAAGVKSQG